MLPVIAIVGRPNVGKSTLFNVLTKTRNALVANIPGVTRDRQYGEALFDERPFIVIDTAGIEGSIDTELEKRMSQQSWQAVEEAQVILFMVDAKEGLTPRDQVIAEHLYRSHKPVLLVVNKTDGLDAAVHSAEFHALGFSEVFSIAASQNRGIQALLAAAAKFFPENSEADLPAAAGIKVAIVGKPNVGKSTLMNRLLGEERVIAMNQPGTTRDSIYIKHEHLGKFYTFIDTAGVRRRSKVDETLEKFSVIKTLQAISDSEVVLFLVDAKEGFKDQDAKLLGYVIESGRAFVVVVNKWDGCTEDEKYNLTSSLDRKLTFADYAKIHKISALHGTGVGDLYKLIQAAYRSAAVDLSTNEVTELLEKAVKEHEPPLVNGRRIKMRYAHMGGQHPPVIVIHGNQLDQVPAAYTRYLENFFRQKLKLVGTPLRFVYKTSHNPFV